MYYYRRRTLRFIGLPDREIRADPQLGIDETIWDQYGEREETRREHLSELRAFLGLTPFGLRQFHQFARWLAELAMQTDKGVVLATALVQELRREKVVCLPSM